MAPRKPNAKSFDKRSCPISEEKSFGCLCRPIDPSDARRASRVDTDIFDAAFFLNNSDDPPGFLTPFHFGGL